MKRWQRVTLYVVGIVGLLVIMVGIAASRSSGTAINTASVTIAKPPAAVFTWLTDPGKRKRWVGGIKGAKSTTQGRPAVGDKIIDIVDVDGAMTEMSATITSLEPDHRLEMSMVTPTFDTTARYELLPKDGGTTLNVEAISIFKTWLGRLVAPTIQKSAQQKLEADLQTLKTKIEKEP